MAVSTQNVPCSSLFIITTDLDNTAARYYAINASAAMVAMFYLSIQQADTVAKTGTANNCLNVRLVSVNDLKINI